MKAPQLSLRRARREQRGAAALVVAVVLLFGMTLTAFFVNRGMLFEQRTSANQYRSTKAFEVAEAGIEWAVARLNDTATVDTSASSCNTGAASALTFADRYLTIAAGSPSPGFSTAAVGRPACSIGSNGAVTCGCPVAGTNATVGSANDPRFMIQFLTGAANGVPDPWTVRVVARGCTNEGTFCNPGSAATPDGVAVVTALYKMRPSLPAGPGAGLVTGAATNVGGNLTVVNLDPKSNGITINSGSVINLDSSTKAVTLPGTPPRSSVLDNDPTLRDLTNADATGELFFKSFMGESFAEYQNNSETWVITSGSCGTNLRCSPNCGTANQCGQAVSTAYTNGAKKFWADTDVAFGNANKPAVTATNPSQTFGTAERPMVIASAAKIEMGGSIVAYGLFYAATAAAEVEYKDPGTGTATVFGSVVSRSRFTKGTGTLNLIYDPNLFSPGQLRGTMVRVPGSWRDSETEL
jgi:Tfp pilus assembly protein PilX